MANLLITDPIIDLLKSIISFLYIPLIVVVALAVISTIVSMLVVHLAKCSDEVERMISAKKFAQISFIAAIVSVILLLILGLFYELA